MDVFEGRSKTKRKSQNEEGNGGEIIDGAEESNT